MSDVSFAVVSLDALKEIGKTLGQMGLYRVGHPAVAASVTEAQKKLSAALAASEKGEVVYVVDADKLIANGRVIGMQNQLPSAIIQLFARYRLNSIAFKSGLTDAELIALCELAALRPEQAKGVDGAAFLKERQVANVVLNEAIYRKVDKAGPGGGSGGGFGTGSVPAKPMPVAQLGAAGGLGPGAGGAGDGKGAQQTLVERIREAPLEQALSEMVQSVTKDPQEQQLLFQTVMERIKRDMESKVREATATIRKEKTVAENEQVRTQSVLTHMAEGVVIVDDQGKVLMMNPAAEELYGVKLVEAAGKPLASQLKEEHVVALATELKTPGDQPIKGSVDVKAAKDDTRRTIRASTAVVQNESGKTVGVVSVLPDVTKQKELDRIEREFIAQVTHELRAPLSSIRAALELLQQGQSAANIPPGEEKLFYTALRNADRLEGLINNILDFSKVESGQMSVHPQICGAEQIAKEGVESLRPWATKKGIQLNLTVDAGLPAVMADMPRTVQVLVNLLSNALKFTPTGGQISVRVSAKSAQDKLVVYSVKDTGPGIAKKDQARIFEKFVQIAAGERQAAGTGLGLAISKALIHLQNGTLWVESEEGKGATFLFTLPYALVGREQAPIPAVQAAAKPWWKKLLGLK